MTRRDTRKAKKKGRERDGSAPQNESRRAFLSTLWIALCGLAVVEYAIAAVNLIRPRRGLGIDDGGDLVVAGPVERFEPGSVAAFPKGKFYLARLDDGGFLAMSRECTHLGCTVPWSAIDKTFACPCHASSFDITGNVLSPPAPRALDLHPVRIENGIVKVDTSRRVRRNAFDAGQVTRA